MCVCAVWMIRRLKFLENEDEQIYLMNILHLRHSHCEFMELNIDGDDTSIFSSGAKIRIQF